MKTAHLLCLITIMVLLIVSPNFLQADISLDHGSIFAVGLRASTISSGDLDGDGDLDLAISNIYSDSLTLGINDGNGNFNEIKELPLDSDRHNPVAVTIGDLDGFGNLDLGVAFIQNLSRTSLDTPAQAGIIFFYSETDGSYTQIYQPIGGIPSSLRIEDLDQDGDSDLLIGNNGELGIDMVRGTILVKEAGMYYFDNLGRGRFSSMNPLLTDGSLVDFLVYDFDQDGINDIVGISQGYTDLDNNFNLIYTEMSLVTFKGIETGLSEFNPDYIDFVPWAIDRGDFNQDGLQDVVVSNVGDIEGLASFVGTNASINLFENKGNRFAALTSIPTPGITFSVLADDFDLDGDVDIVATVEEIVDMGSVSRLDASLHIYENDGQANFTETGVLTLAEEPRYAVKGDFDNDGDTDIAVLCTIVDTASKGTALNGEVYVFFNNAKTAIPSWDLY